MGDSAGTCPAAPACSSRADGDAAGAAPAWSQWGLTKAWADVADRLIGRVREIVQDACEAGDPTVVHVVVDAAIAERRSR